MPKITGMTVTIEPATNEDKDHIQTVTLVRGKNKMWSALPARTEGGLFSGEINLVHHLNNVIAQFNGGQIQLDSPLPYEKVRK